MISEKSLRILILEDVPTDAELVERALRKAGFAFTARRTDTRKGFVEALESFKPDVVLCDYKLPEFDGLSAIELVREKSADLPVIAVTGALGDEAAVALIKAGATDYIMKDRLPRLAFAVERALSDAKEIHSRKQAEVALAESELKLKAIFSAAPDGILLTDLETWKFLAANDSICRMLGYSREELHELGVLDIHPEEDLPLVAEEFERRAKGKTGTLIEWPMKRKDGSIFFAEINDSPLTVGGKPCLMGIFRDVTERKRSEKRLRRVTRALRTLSSGNAILVRAKDRDKLQREFCQVVLDAGDYRLVWIGQAEHDEDKTVRLAAVAGLGREHLAGLQLTWADRELGLGPTGMAIRTGLPQVAPRIADGGPAEPWRIAASEMGVNAILSLPLRDQTGVFGALSIYSAESDAFEPEEVELLTELAGDLSFGIVALQSRADRDAALARLESSMEETLRVVAATLERRDPYTAGHEERVAKIAAAIAQDMGLPEDQVHGIRLACIVHDLGKIGIAAEILSKPGRLSATEYELIKEHPQIGYDILKGVDFPWPIAQAVLQHHERMDGSGYPSGLKGEAILLEARIIAVADVVEAMISHRPFRPALGLDAALAEIEKGRGRLYDPAVVDSCLELSRAGGLALDGNQNAAAE